MADKEEEYSQEPDEEQGIEQEGMEEEDMEREMGKKDEEPYDEAGREKLAEDDEMHPREEGFMEGYEERGEQSKCAHCGKILDEDNTVEREIDGELVWFCSDKCAQEHKKK